VGKTALPIIEGLNGKIGILERRLEHLKRRAEKSTGASRDFDLAEAGALRAALDAMRFVAQERPQ
jgi:hypothetical protein